MRLHVALTLGFASVITSQAYAQSDTLVMKRQAELRQLPAETAASLGVLTAQSPVTRLPARQGAWIQVKSAAGTTGWVHMFDVSNSSQPSAAASTTTGALRGLTNFFNRGSAQNAGPTTATSTVGIRGLTGEDIANAQPDLNALAQAEGLRQDESQARRFAAELALKVRAVDPLPAPAPTPTERKP